jgi:hypothetical protein
MEEYLTVNELSGQKTLKVCAIQSASKHLRLESTGYGCNSETVVPFCHAKC